MKDKYVAYVGTYTHGSSIGIHLYDVNVEEGTLCERKVVPVNNSSHLARSLNGKYLYSIADEGVAVFAIEPVGFLLSTPFYVIGQAWILAPKSQRNPVRFALLGVLSAVAIYCIFKFGFQLLVPPGILG